MPQSCKVTGGMIKALRDHTGVGLVECKNALVHCNGDALLAEGWLKYYGCAINTYDEPHEEWAMRNARAYKERVLKDPDQRLPSHIQTIQNQ